MKKHAISIVNCFLSVFLFLCVFGNTCYRYALPGKGGTDFEQQKALCYYFAIFIVIAIYCICAKPYDSNKCFWSGAVFCILFSVILSFLWIRYLVFRSVFNWPAPSLNWVQWIYSIVPPVISGLYVYAALVKE